MKKIYSLLLSVMLLCGALAVNAQNRVITGIVKDVDGSLPGVSVLEKGAPNNGVGTNLDGSFQITLRGNSNVLIFRGVSYVTQEVNVRGKQNITVTLAADTKGLEEVVVVGYGTQKKIAVTGAVSSVTREEIQQTPSASLQNSLSGKMPGFSSQQRGGRPGADAADFYIRGQSTFSGTVQPLILVDDVPFTYADFANIDPNEVQSVSILKDAATTAPYGVKGANGVILVTTRRGQVGTARITVRSEFGEQVPTYTPKFLDAANTAKLVNVGKLNDYIITNGTSTGFVAPFTQADIDLYANGTDPYVHPNVDWYNTLLKKSSPISKNNLDVSGGTAAVKYFISAGYQSQGGMLRDFHNNDGVNNGYYFDRFNFRSNLDINATKSLSFKLDMSGNNNITNYPQPGSRSNSETATMYEIYEYEFLNPYIYPIYNPDGSYGFANPNGTVPVNNNIIGRFTTGGYRKLRENLLSLNISAIQKLDALTQGLQAKVQVSVVNRTTATKLLGRMGSVNNFPSYYYNGTTYTPRDSKIYRTEPYNLTYDQGTPIRQSNFQFNLNYARSFGKNNVSALILYNQTTNLANNTDVLEAYKPENFRGVTSRVSYNYNNKYLVEFNGSYNGSDKFAASHRYGFFPAASAGYVISEEGFIKDNFKFISLLKFRGSYGIVGSDNLGSYQSFYEENFKRGGDVSFGETSTPYTSIIPNLLGNDHVSWERERKTNVGVDFGFINGKITGSVDVFDNKRSDILLIPGTYADYFGLPDAALPPENIGIVSNKGYEIELAYNGKIGKDFSFNLKGNYSYVKNKILANGQVPPVYPYQSAIGRSIGEVALFVFDGYYSVAEANDPTVPKYSGSHIGSTQNVTLPGFLKYRDMNGDGVITNDDQAFIGRSNLPTTTVGFNPSFAYKRFSLNVLLQTSWGNDVRVGFVYSAPFRANLQEVHQNYWTPETAATATFPSLTWDFAGTYMSNNHSQYWATDGKYLRLKSLEFAYRLPEKWINKIGLASGRIYANAYDLKTWSTVFNRTGMDAEVANQELFGDYTGVYPQQAIINLGLNLTFK